MKYLIVGGVAGGASTAARLRRLDEESRIIMLERGDHISYANCGLPYYIGEVIDEREKLLIQTPESFAARFNVEVRVRSDVRALSLTLKSVVVQDLVTRKYYEESYDKLILAPGAVPVFPVLEGMGLNRIFILRGIHDSDAIKAFIDTCHVKRVLIVGAGFIGLEMAENLHELGIQVTIIEKEDQAMAQVDYEIVTAIHQHCKAKGVELYLQQKVKSFNRMEDDRIKATLESGLEFQIDMVILSMGTYPDVCLAEGVGLEIGMTGGIKVNEFLQTSNEDVYAVGDAIEFPNPVSNSPALAFLAGPANKQGRICADNLVYGNCRKYKGAVGTMIAKFFDLTIGATGLSAKMLDRMNIPYKEIVVHGASHAGYYPGATMMDIKINFSPKDGKLLGAFAVGAGGIDKRLEMMSAVIRAGGTIYDLMELEQAYAPPYSSARDLVNVAGFVADNLLSGKVNVIGWRELKDMDRSKIMLIDVRSVEEFKAGSIDGAINIPLDGCREEYKKMPKDQLIIVFCAIGLRGYIAARILMQSGCKVQNLNGGYRTYQAAIVEQSNWMA